MIGARSSTLYQHWFLEAPVERYQVSLVLVPISVPPGVSAVLSCEMMAKTAGKNSIVVVGGNGKHQSEGNTVGFLQVDQLFVFWCQSRYDSAQLGKLR